MGKLSSVIAPLIYAASAVCGALAYHQHTTELDALRHALASLETEVLSLRSASPLQPLRISPNHCPPTAATASNASPTGSDTLPASPLPVLSPRFRGESEPPSVDHEVLPSAADEGPLEQLEQRFAGKAALIDAAQGDPMADHTPGVSSALTRILPDGNQILDVACAGELCRIELEHADSAAVERLATALFDGPSPGSQRTLQTLEEDGSITSVLFLTMDGSAGGGL